MTVWRKAALFNPAQAAAAEIAKLTKLPFVSAPNKFAALAGHEPLVAFHGALCAAALVVMSPFGLSLVAIRGNTLRASALGVPVNARLVAIYTIAAAYAGAAGALLAQTTAYVSLEVLEFNRSADVMLALIIGGTGWLYGGIAGAVVFKILQDTLASSSPQFWMFWLGLFLVALAVVGRDRLSAMVLRAVRR